jgi:hypothetical protein
MSTNFSQAITDLVAEINSEFKTQYGLNGEPVNNRQIKIKIGQTVAMVPALVLSVKAVKAHGLIGSLRPKNYLPVMRDNKVASAIYLAGLGYAYYQQGAKFYQAWKASQIPEIQYGYDVTEPTKTEVWAADLAEGDVTIFDRLMQVRAQALKLVQEQGLEIKPDKANPYFNIDIAREELANMEPHELERVEEILNRRLVALINEGGEADAEEKALHASLIVLEEELDERRLQDDQFDRETDRMITVAEGHEEHREYQHVLKAPGFNTGFSTTVDDLVDEGLLVSRRSDVDTNAGLKVLKEVLAKQTPGDVVYLVQLERYTGRMGLHLITKADPGVRWDFGNRTIGLVSTEDANEAAEYFRGLDVQGGQTVSLFSEADPTLKDYIRSQVIPLEWKRKTDSELDASGVLVDALQIPQI